MEIDRKRELRTMLMRRRQDVAVEIMNKVHDARIEGSSRRSEKVSDLVERVANDIQDEIDLSIIQMKTDTLGRIDQALGRLDRDAYGFCSECNEEIAEKRLRALPFAIRCKDCEEVREVVEQSERSVRRRQGFGNFTNFID